MVYKWCVVPQCTNTSIKSPHKMFVSVPTNRKRRIMWLQLAGRDPNAIQAHSNIFMCEDHLDMEKDTTNYMQYKMGFSQKILLTDEAVPTKFHCIEDRKRRLSDAGSSGEGLLKMERIDVPECLQSQSATETYNESSLKDNAMVQVIIKHEELPKTQDKETNTDPIISAEKSVQVRTKVHYRSKSVQTICQNKSISTSPLKATTTSHYTSPFKTAPSCLKRLQSGVVKTAKRNIILEDEKSNR